MQIRTVSSGGRIWRYRIAGEGSDVIFFLPGALGSGDLMADCVSRLLPGFRILVPEYAPAVTVNEFLQAFDAMCSCENIQDLYLYGSSFGGLLAQCWARKDPPPVQILILSGTGIPDAQRIFANKRMLRILPFLPMPVIRFLMKTAAGAITRKTPQDKDLWRKELSSLAAGIQREDLASRYRTTIDFDQNYRFTPEDFQHRPVRILLLEGRKDRIAGKKIREAMRAFYPKASVVTFDNAGHSAMLTHPQDWQGVVQSFLKRLI